MSSEIIARMNEYVSTFGALDAEAVSDFYADHPDFRVYSDGVAYTRDSLVSLVRTLCDSLQSFDAQWERIEVTPLGDDAALAAARFTRSFVDGEGQKTEDWGAVTWVWIRDDGSWRLIHGQAVHYPGDLPPVNAG